ncbi:MAG: hypothetical protein AAGD33_14265 [Actinomycetota bacterium]
MQDPPGDGAPPPPFDPSSAPPPPEGYVPPDAPPPSAGAMPPPGAVPPGTIPPGAHPDGGQVPFTTPEGGDDGDATKRGVIIGSAIGAGVIAVGAIVGLTVFGDDDESDAGPRTTLESEAPETTEPEPTAAPTTEPSVSVEPTTTVTDSTTTTEAPPTTQAGDPTALVGAAVRFATFDVVLDEAQTQQVLLELGSSTDVLVAQTPNPVQLCAGLANPAPLSVSVLWELDGQPIREVPSSELTAPSGGDCLADAAGLATGSYQVLFTAMNGTEAPIVTFTVGVEPATQSFVNDTGQDLCSLEIAPTTTGYFEPFFDGSTDVYVPVDGIVSVPLAAVEHEARGVPCGASPLDGFFFEPGGGELRLSDGGPVGPEPVDDETLIAAFGLIGSSPQLLDEAGQNVLASDVLDPDAPLVVASTEPSRTLCAVYELPAPFSGVMVWEFNGVELIRNPIAVAGGTVVDCIPPGGDTHGEGAYQAYLDRDSILSGVATFTVGRDQTALSFVNDTGVEICDVGFSPDLTNFYTIYSFLGSDAFGDPLTPGETFQITAPFIENDIRAIDCDGTTVSENFSIPPTDATVSLQTGQP